MTAEFLIRPLAAGDQPAWEPLWRAYLAFYDTTPSDAQCNLTFARYIDPAQADMHAWLAERDGTAVALVHVIVHAHGWQADPVTYLQDLYAVPEARGLGMGRALIETVYADADAAAARTSTG